MKKIYKLFLAAILVVCVFMAGCALELTGTIILENKSSHEISSIDIVKAANNAGTGKNIRSYNDLNIAKEKGIYRMTAIPAGKYHLYAGLSSFPFIGGFSPEFELRPGEIKIILYNGTGDWVIW